MPFGDYAMSRAAELRRHGDALEPLVQMRLKTCLRGGIDVRSDAVYLALLAAIGSLEVDATRLERSAAEVSELVSSLKGVL